MASAREYFRQRRNGLKEEEYRVEISLHRRKRMLIIAGVVAAIAVVAAGIFIFNNNRTYSDYDVVSEVKRNDDDSTVYVDFKDNMIKYNMDGISCVDSSSKLIWNKTYEMKSPILDVCNGFAVICDDGGNKIYIFNEEGLQGEVETKFPIKKICTSGKGTVVALMQEDSINYIDYYNKNGKLISENKSPVEKTGFPLDISISGDGYKLAVSYMMIENASVVTKLAFYNFDSVGENEIDHLVAATTYSGDIIPEVEFLTDDIAVAFGTGFWEVYEGTQKPKSILKKDVSKEIKSIFYGEEYVGFVFENDTKENLYCMEVYSLKGKKILDYPFSFEYEDVFIKNSLIYMYNSASCEIVSMGGKTIYSGSFEDELKNVIPQKKSRMTVVFADKIKNLQLK